MFSTNYLFASLVWGSVGVGYFIYGKKQQSMSAMLGGVLIVALSYFTSSALAITLLSLAMMVVIYFLMKRGY